MAAEPQALWLVRPTLGQGGADRVTVELLRALDRAVWRPTLVLVRREGELLPEVPADVPVVGLGAASLWSAWLPLARRLRREPPRILFSTSGGANLAAALAHLLGPPGVRLVLSERNALVRDQPAAKRWLQLALKRRLYRRAWRLTAVSEGVAGELVTRLGIDRERIAVVRNPVVPADLARRTAEPAPHPWLGGEPPVVLGAGRLVPAKGFDVLIDAFARLRRSRPARLILLGEGPLRGALERRAEALGVAEDVALPGFVANPFAFLARAAVFVLSSRFEGLPGVLVQALACGTPAVATRCPHGPSELIRSGESGLLVEVDDARGLAASIARVLDEPGLGERLARRGREAAAPYAPRPAVASYVEALRGEP